MAGNALKDEPAVTASLPRLLGVVAAVALLAIGMSVFLDFYKFKSAVQGAERSRMLVPAAAVGEGFQQALALGVPLTAVAAGQDLLQRERLTDSAITEVCVFDPAGRILYSTDPAAIGSTANPSWMERARRASARGWHTDEDGQAVVGVPIRNSFDVEMGQVAVRYSLSGREQALRQMRGEMAWMALWGYTDMVVLATLALGFALRPRTADGAAAQSKEAARKRRPTTQGRLTAAILLATALGLAGVFFQTYRLFDAGLEPQLARKAGVVGASVTKLVGKALDHGISLGDLVGVDTYLKELLRQHPELAHVAVRDATGKTRFESGPDPSTPAVSVPIVREGSSIGAVEVRVRPEFVRDILRELLVDLAAVLVVVVFLARELLQFITATDPRLGAARTEDGAVLARVRAPLFLFMLAEELTRAFLPGFARQFPDPQWGISADVLAGLPIMVFMLMVALGQPLLASWSERVGPRRALLGGTVMGALGLGGAALAAGIADFMAWRALCGIGYATVFVAGQGYVIRHTAGTARTRGFGLFVSAIAVAGVCGPPIGGILADHLGARWGFGLAAIVAASALLALAAVPREEPGRETAPLPKMIDFLRLLARRRFVLVTVLAAVPAKAILASFCFYLVPLYALAIGATSASAGRALMVYSGVMVLVLPLAARFAERGVGEARLVGTGLCLSTLGGFGLYFWDGLMPVYLAMALLGFGQGLSIAAQSSLLSIACAREIEERGSGPVFGVYRLIERLGNASGPILAGVLVVHLGHRGAFAAIAGAVLCCGLLFLVLGRNLGVRRPLEVTV
jgi:predicted MFS family arabinose efflux permease